MPANPQLALSETLCTDWTGEGDPGNAGSPSRAIYFIVSFENFTKSGYISSTTIHAKFKSNLQAYLVSIGTACK